MDDVVLGTDRLTNTIKLGTHYAMMHNSRDDINQIINNIARQQEISNIRIYNKRVKLSIRTSRQRSTVKPTSRPRPVSSAIAPIRR